MKVALRMDDVNASTKKFLIYSKKFRRFPIGNLLFLKKTPYFRAWGQYNELNTIVWHEIISILKKYNAKLTIGITACWVTEDSMLVPFNISYPEEFEIVKKGVDENVFEIANHGLTHCVLKNKSFLPKNFSSNRVFHREFWPWIDLKTQEQHIKKSQEILTKCFKKNIKVFVPPGNVFNDNTVEISKKYGIEIVNCQTKSRNHSGIKILSNRNVIDFHDREIAIYGTRWLEEKIIKNKGKEFCFVSELS